MPTQVPAVPGSSESRKRVAVFAGNLKRTIKKPDGTRDKNAVRPAILNVRKSVQEALNLPLATSNQTERKEGEKEIEYDGTFHGKTVYVPDPTGKKTAKGKVKVYSFKVPGFMTKKQIKDFLAPTKAESFRLNGRLKAIPKGK